MREKYRSSFGPVSPGSSLLKNWQLDCFFFLGLDLNLPGSKGSREGKNLSWRKTGRLHFTMLSAA